MRDIFRRASEALRSGDAEALASLAREAWERGLKEYLGQEEEAEGPVGGLLSPAGLSVILPLLSPAHRQVLLEMRALAERTGDWRHYRLEEAQALSSALAYLSLIVRMVGGGE